MISAWLLLLCASTASCSLVPEVELSATFGGSANEQAYSVQQTQDGGFIIAGQTKSYGTGTDAYLVKTDQSGKEQWHKNFGGSSQDICYSVRQTKDGGFILAGQTVSYGTGGDVYLVKTDSSGNELWHKNLGGSGGELGRSVQQTQDGGFIIVGDIYSGTANAIYLLKTDSAGNEVWHKSLGESLLDHGYSVMQTQDGGYIIEGANIGGIVLIKTDASGNMIWSKNLGGTVSALGAVLQTSDGGFAVAGDSWSNGQDMYLIKTDSAGNEIWNGNYGGSGTEHCFFAQETTNGGFILAGSTDSFGAGGDAFVVKTDGEGNEIWRENYGGSGNDIAFSVQQTQDGGFVMVGYSGSYGNAVDVWLLKLRAFPVLSYPDFTDTTNPDSWRSWLVLQNPTGKAANIHLEIYSRSGDLLYHGDGTIPAHGVYASRPSSLIGSDCSGSAILTSDQPIIGTCQVNRNSNEMCMEYNAILL